MYQVVIINDGVETVINAVSTDKDAPKISSGVVKQGINVINSFTFTIYKDNPGFDLLYEYKTLIKVFNVKTKRYEFIGRVLPSSSNMNDKGLFYKNITCESELGFLIDSIQDYEEYHNISIKEYLETLINNHNSRIEKYKRFKVKNINVEDSNDSLYRYSSYSSTFENIKSDLLEKLGGELRVYHDDDDNLCLDYLKEIGKISDTEIRFKQNLKSISIDPNLEGFYTRLKVLGAKLKSLDSEGNEIDTDKRLTIKSINNGLDYIDYKEGIDKFGIIEGTITFDDITDVNNLLLKGKNYVDSLKISISNSITALDLSILGLDFDSFEVGNYHPVIVEPLNINYLQRIIEKTIQIRNPAANTITLGDKKVNIKDYYLNNAKVINKTAQENKLNVAEIKAEVSQSNTSILNKIEIIEGDYISMSAFNTKLNEINQNFQQINSRLDALEGGAN